ncbi:hypothetical protein ACFOKK_02395 [Sphingobium fuliginis]
MKPFSGALVIDAMNLKNVLRDIQSDRGNLHVGGSFLLMVDDSTIMARLDAVRWGAVHLITALTGALPKS